MVLSLIFFKRTLMLFWVLWWLVAFLTDLGGAMFQLGWFSENWLPHSIYPYLVKTIALFDPRQFLARLLFAGIICWLFLSTAFFVRAVFTSTLRRDVWIARVNSAFINSLALWLAIFTADQVVK